jgi:hypothetical protein
MLRTITLAAARYSFRAATTEPWIDMQQLIKQSFFDCAA